MTEIDEIKKLAKEGKLIIGTDVTLKKLRAGKIKRIWLSSNVPTKLKEEILKYAKLAEAVVLDVSLPNDELSVLCKKQFPVSIVSEGED